MGKSWKKWRKVGISGERGEKLKKVGKNENFAKNGRAGHFGLPKFTFDRISRHFRSIRNFFFLNLFSKWQPAAILEVPFEPFWMTENHFRSHFSPFQINTQLFFFLIYFQNGRRPPCWKSLLSHFG